MNEGFFPTLGRKSVEKFSANFKTEPPFLPTYVPQIFDKKAGNNVCMIDMDESFLGVILLLVHTMCWAIHFGRILTKTSFNSQGKECHKFTRTNSELRIRQLDSIPINLQR